MGLDFNSKLLMLTGRRTGWGEAGNEGKARRYQGTRRDYFRLKERKNFLTGVKKRRLKMAKHVKGRCIMRVIVWRYIHSAADG